MSTSFHTQISIMYIDIILRACKHSVNQLMVLALVALSLSFRILKLTFPLGIKLSLCSPSTHALLQTPFSIPSAKHCDRSGRRPADSVQASTTTSYLGRLEPRQCAECSVAPVPGAPPRSKAPGNPVYQCPEFANNYVRIPGIAKRPLLSAGYQ